MKNKIVDFLWYILGAFVTILLPPIVAGLGTMAIKDRCGWDSWQIWLWIPMILWLWSNYMKSGKK